MKKSLKTKFRLVYLCLILTIAIIGIVSVNNFNDLNGSIDSLLTNNYRSISATNNMLQSIEKQDNALFSYVNSQTQDGIDQFFSNKTTFDYYYKIQENNFTEKGEKEITLRISSNYSKYLMCFSVIQEIKNLDGVDAAFLYYKLNISPISNIIEKDLSTLSKMNETAMYSHRDNLSNTAHSYKYIILIFSMIAVISSLILSNYFINMFLAPIYELTENIKAIGEGFFRKHTTVKSEDEIGQLSLEFNKMTARLEEYEQSTLGKFLTEKNKFSAIVKSLADPLIVLDNEHKIVIINDAAQDFFDIKEMEVTHKDISSIITNEDLYSHISNALDSKEENNSKILLFNLQNKDYYFNVITTLIKDNTSSINGVVVLFQNITQLKQLEKVKADFISTISHEFKTPLTSIMMGASLIEDENIGVLNFQQKKIIFTIKEDGERLSELVTNLLQLSRIEWSKSIFSMRSCSILGIVEQSIKNFYDQASSKDISLLIDLDEKLPKIYGDPEKISWIINNLVSNALKYTNAGDEISISANVKQEKMFISVKDTGVGIPHEYLKKIFDQFVQVKGYDFEVRGTGLGLTLAKEIVNAHAGEIWCESQIDVGSTFTFTLPLQNKE